MTLCPGNQCTGCAACLCGCPTQAISMQEDAEGFLVPYIEKLKCTECGLCREICPSLTDIYELRFESPKVYAAWSLDESIRTDSSSGGMFSVLANHVLSNSGIVFGAAFDEKFKLQHYEAKTSSELLKLRGSKYLQSNVGNTYIKVKHYLDNSFPVMFAGTPCQVAGLYSYLNNDYTKLITCDLVCHGVPSQRLFDAYLRYLRSDGCLKFDDISFRDKKKWNCATILHDNFVSGQDLFLTGQQAYFLKAFMLSFVYRKSCYSCKYARLPRIGDLTLGDFWGLGEDIPFYHDKSQGVSLLIVNSSRGKEVLQSCRNGLFLEERTMSEAQKRNAQIYRASEYPVERDSFLVDIQTIPIDKIWKKYQLKDNLTIKGILCKSIRYAIGQRGVNFIKRKLKR